MTVALEEKYRKDLVLGYIFTPTYGIQFSKMQKNQTFDLIGKSSFLLKHLSSDPKKLLYTIPNHITLPKHIFKLIR
jgi:hypothetical protein